MLYYIREKKSAETSARERFRITRHPEELRVVQRLKKRSSSSERDPFAVSGPARSAPSERAGVGGVARAQCGGQGDGGAPDGRSDRDDCRTGAYTDGRERAAAAAAVAAAAVTLSARTATLFPETLAPRATVAVTAPRPPPVAPSASPPQRHAFFGGTTRSRAFSGQSSAGWAGGGARAAPAPPKKKPCPTPHLRRFIFPLSRARARAIFSYIIIYLLSPQASVPIYVYSYYTALNQI